MVDLGAALAAIEHRFAAGDIDNHQANTLNQMMCAYHGGKDPKEPGKEEWTPKVDEWVMVKTCMGIEQIGQLETIQDIGPGECHRVYYIEGIVENFKIEDLRPATDEEKFRVGAYARWINPKDKKCIVEGVVVHRIDGNFKEGFYVEASNFCQMHVMPDECTLLEKAP